MHENTLVHQKDTLLTLINGNHDGFDMDHLSQMEVALGQLDTLCELWCLSTYHYKGRELCASVRRTVSEMRADTTNWKRRSRLDRISTQAGVLEAKFWQAECDWKAGRTPSVCV